MDWRRTATTSSSESSSWSGSNSIGSPTPLLRPRTREALTELDYILEDQVAALADATDDDKADAATWAA
jgi:hypothetical protein